MPDEPMSEPRPWLSDHFIRMDLPRIEERRLIGKPKLRFGPLMLELAHFYEVGAVLGSARPDCAEELIKICFDRWDNIGMFLNQSDFHLSLLQKSGEPNYLDLIFEILYSNVPAHGRLEFLSASAGKEQSRDEAVATLRMVFMWGIAFGSRFPTLTADLYNAAHQTGGTSVPEVKGTRIEEGESPRSIIPGMAANHRR